MKAVKPSPPTGRSLERQHISEYCPRYRHAVELIGRRWTGAILRVLIGGPRRFNEILSAVPGLSDRLLAARLRELDAELLVVREVRPGPPIAVEYRLTESGRDFESVIRAVDKWVEKRVEAQPKAG